MSVDAQNVVDFEDGLNKVFDWIEGLKQLPPPRDVEDPLALAEWFREFHQLSRTVLALPDTDLLRRFAQDVELALGQRQEGPPRVAGEVKGPRMGDVRRAKVTAIKDADGAAWSDLETSGWIATVTANPVDADGTADAGHTLTLRATLEGAVAAPGDGEVGFADISVGDIIEYALTPYTDGFDGLVLPHGGQDGAILSTHIVGSDNVTAGPGVSVIDDSGAAKVSLDAVGMDAGGGDWVPNAAGLEFVGVGDAGKVRVAVGDGLELAGNNVAIDLAANPGLQFTGGDLDAKPDTARGLDKDGSGLFIDILAAEQALAFSGGDLYLLEDTARALATDASGLYVKADPNYGLECNAVDGLRVKVQTAGPGTAGVVFNASGELRVRADTDVGIDVDDDGIKMKIDDTAGLNFNASGELEIEITGENLTFSGGDLAHNTPGVEAYDWDSAAVHAFSLDANGHVRWMGASDTHDDNTGPCAT